ncbi:MAG: ATP-binding protein [Candidatus Thorarchaeota archaeon]
MGTEIVDEEDVYRALQQHLDRMPIGFPPAESGTDIQLLKQLFNTIEARIAVILNHSFSPSDTLDDIYHRSKSLGISKDELEKILDAMVEKGLIHSRRDRSTRFYSNAQFFVGIYELQLLNLNKDFLEKFSLYYRDAFWKEVLAPKPTQLRVIPVEKSITLESPIASYEDIDTMIDAAEGPFVVGHCLCRKIKSLYGQPCKVTDREETCLILGPYAEVFIDAEWGREINREELRKIIKDNQHDGLVLQPSNSGKLEFLCSCCSCCCGLLRAKSSVPRPIDFFTTNNFAEVDLDLCSSCGTCVEKCQMRALSLEDEVLNVDLDRCIGCGLCVVNCPDGALSLQKREHEWIPPKSMQDTYSILLERKK